MTSLALVGAVLLLAANAFFVGAEFAVISVRRSQVEPLVSAGGRAGRRARVVLDGLSDLSIMLAAAQLGITLCSLGLGAVAEPAIAGLLEGALEQLHVPKALLHPIAFASALTVVVFLHMVLGEMVPKNIAIATPERASLVLVPPLVAFARFAGPVLRRLNGMANRSLTAVGVQPKDELTSSYSPDELADIIAESRSEGLLEPGEHERLANALALRELTAADIMVGLDAIITVDEDTTADELEELVVMTGFSRFPVRARAEVSGPPDALGGSLVGFVHVKDVLGMTAAARRRPLPAALRRRMPQLPADMPLQEVLVSLQRSRSHLAQVLDARGVIGVIALQGVVERFVGREPDVAPVEGQSTVG